MVRDAHKAYVRETALDKALAQRIAKLETDAYAVRAFGARTARVCVVLWVLGLLEPLL